MNKILIFTLVLFSGLVSAEIYYVKYYEGLPEFDTNNPFEKLSISDYNKIYTILDAYSENNECVIDQIYVQDGWNIDRNTNICHKAAFNSIIEILSSKSTILIEPERQLSISKADQNRLIITYQNLIQGKLMKYPYLSVWGLTRNGNKYKLQYGETFLDAEYFGTYSFGNKGELVTFVKFNSCIECESFVFLAPIEFSKSGPYKAKNYRFNYSLKVKEYTSYIEYYLPGMGHSVSADTQTKIMPASENGPHMIQYFDMLGQGPNEWWIFKCNEYKCDNEYYENKLPKKYQSLWNKAGKPWIETGRNRAY